MQEAEEAWVRNFFRTRNAVGRRKEEGKRRKKLEVTNDE